MEEIVVDTDEEVYDLATAKQFDRAFEYGENRASDDAIRAEAEVVVSSCLSEVEGHHNSMRGKWRTLERLWRLHSVSEAAQEFNVHLGGGFAAVEELAAKMEQTAFGSGSLIGGDPEDRGDSEKAKKIVALINEQMHTELNLQRDAQAGFREIGIYGRHILKIVPSMEIKRVIQRHVRSDQTMAGDTVYRFTEPEHKELVEIKHKKYEVSAHDFRIPPTASSVDEAGWCGDFSYPTEKEINDLVERGVYDKAQVDHARDSLRELKKTATRGRSPNGGGAYMGQIGDGAAPDAGAHVDQFAQFEWWGDFDINHDGKIVPCVITMLVPSRGTSPKLQTGFVGRAVRVRENPFYHQRKPYVAGGVNLRSRQFWGVSPMEVVARNSHFEDEMSVLGLMQAYLEASPPLEVGQAAAVPEGLLDGFLPGKTIPVARTGEIGYLSPPLRSSVAFQVAEYFGSRSLDRAGLGRPQSAPRAPAAGVITDAQQLDLFLQAYVSAWEQSFLVPTAELCHGLNKQYMTEERKIKTMGASGFDLPDIRVISPVDIAIDIRLEATVGKRLAERFTQTQALVNWWDRMMMANQVMAQSGRGEMFDMFKAAQMIWRDGMGFKDMSFISRPVDPGNMLNPAQEHRAFAMGEALEVQKGENIMVHMTAHLQFVNNGEADDWDPENKQKLVEHIHETIDALSSQVAQEMPGAQEMIQEIMGQVPDSIQPSSPGGAGQGGGRGIAGATQSPSSPKFRPPTQGGPGMSMPNTGSM